MITIVADTLKHHYLTSIVPKCHKAIMRRILPPLNGLRAFEAAGRLGSFTRAAEELNVSHSAISRHVRGLVRIPMHVDSDSGVFGHPCLTA